MVVVLRPPFFVPRPPDDNIWNAAPTDAPVIPFLTKQTMFGKGGQVPAKQWHYDYDVAESSWNAAPVDSTIIPYLTKQTMFGKGGQVPAKQWHYDYNVAESSWNAAPTAAPVIPFLTKQTMFGKGGQVPSKLWRYDFDVAESFWNAASIDSPIIAFLTKQKLFDAGGQVPVKQWHYEYDDQSIWSGSPISTKFISTIIVKQIVAPFFVPNPGQDTYWSNQINKDLALLSLPIAKVFFGLQWKYNIDEISVWQRQSLNPISLFLVIYKTGSFYPIVNDDPSIWYKYSVRNPLTAIPISNPFVNRQPQNNDDASAWFGSPLRSTQILSLTLYQTGNQYFNYVDDQAVWTNKSSTVFSLFPVIGRINTTRQWHYDYDDHSSWSPVVSRNLANFVAQQVHPFVAGLWNFSADDPAVWKQSAQRDLSLSVPAATYFNAKQSPVAGDDSSVWQWKPTNFIAQFLMPYKTTESLKFTFYDDASGWQWQPVNFNVLFLNPYQVGNRYFTYLDDVSIWQWSKPPSIISAGVPFVVDRWQTDTPHDQLWSIYKYHNAAVSLNVPESFIIRQPSFAYDDHSSWQWPIKSEIILSLKWNIHSHRIAKTVIENRSAQTSVEKRTATASPEKRSDDAKDN